MRSPLASPLPAVLEFLSPSARADLAAAALLCHLPAHEPRREVGLAEFLPLGNHGESVGALERVRQGARRVLLGEGLLLRIEIGDENAAFRHDRNKMLMTQALDSLPNRSPTNTKHGGELTL